MTSKIWELKIVNSQKKKVSKWRQLKQENIPVLLFELRASRFKDGINFGRCQVALQFHFKWNGKIFWGELCLKLWEESWSSNTASQERFDFVDFKIHYNPFRGALKHKKTLTPFATEMNVNPIHLLSLQKIILGGNAWFFLTPHYKNTQNESLLNH